MKLIISLIMVSITFDSFCNYPQEDLQKMVLKIQSAQNSNEKDAKIFERFLPSEMRVFQHLDFNIKNLTAISKCEPINRPGWAPDWGTDIFESMWFENLTFQDCNFKWLDLSNTTFKNIKFSRCNFEGTVFDEAILQDVAFEDCNLRDSSFCKSKLSHVLFQKNNATYVNFMEAHLINVSYISNDLQGCNFFGATADSFSIHGDIKNVLFYNITKDVNINKPVVLISWDNKNPGLAAAKIVKKIQDLGGIPFKINYKDSDIDYIKLTEEVKLIVKQINSDLDKSLAKKILDIAKEGNFPEISKIQKKAHEWVSAVSGVLIPGGQDIQPFFYGQDSHPKTNITSDLRRDLFEFAILDEIEAMNIPLLGVCRGMQVVNVWRGGSLKQHVEGHLYLAQKYRLVKEHSDSIIANIFHHSAEPFIGYSFHHQAIDSVGRELTVMASSEDGTIKALEMLGKRFMVLVQWHPEFKGDHSTPEAAQLDAKLSSGNHELYEKFIKAAQETQRQIRVDPNP